MSDQQKTGIEKAVAIKGSASALAAAIGISPQFMDQILKGERPLPPRRAFLAEQETGIRRWDLLPKDWWEHWPDLIGAEGAPAVETNAV